MNKPLGVVRSEEICDLSLVIARNETEDDEGAAELNDVFVSCVAALKKEWGESFLLEAGKEPAVSWRLPGGTFVQVTGGFTAILFQFITPQGWWYFT